MLGLDKQSRLNRRLRAASASGDLLAIEKALKEGAEIEWQGSRYFNGTALQAAAIENKPDAIRVLLEHGADINTKDSTGDTPLINAVRRGYTEAAKVLLDHGADIHVVGEGNRTVMDYLDKVPLLRKRIEELYNPPVSAPATSPAPVTPPRVENVEEVVILRPLGNRMLEEVFNFASKERITLLRNGMDGPVEAMTRESFSTIEDQSGLRYAFGIYKARGGKAEERDIFPDALHKTPFPGRG